MQSSILIHNSPLSQAEIEAIIAQANFNQEVVVETVKPEGTERGDILQDSLKIMTAYPNATSFGINIISNITYDIIKSGFKALINKNTKETAKPESYMCVIKKNNGMRIECPKTMSEEDVKEIITEVVASGGYSYLRFESNQH
jgi:hypothetical protein